MSVAEGLVLLGWLISPERNPLVSCLEVEQKREEGSLFSKWDFSGLTPYPAGSESETDSSLLRVNPQGPAQA